VSPKVRCNFHAQRVASALSPQLDSSVISDSLVVSVNDKYRNVTKGRAERDRVTAIL
jgi:hypothetical protein